MEYESIAESKTKNSTTTIMIIICVVILIAIIGVVIYGVYQNTKTPEDPKCTESTTCPSCTKTAPGIWATRDNTYTLDDAKKYCQAQGGKLADHTQIIKAGSSGNLQSCKKGWFMDPSGDSAIGRYINDPELCNSTQRGWQVSGGVDNKSANAFVYCQANIIPADRSVSDIAVAM
jgi:hypothetical protein